MKRKLTSILLFSALLVGGASTFVSCTDNESDNAYNASASLADAIAKQKAELTGLNTWLGELKNQNPSLAEAIDARIKENLAAMDKGAISELGQYATLDAAIKGSEAYQGLESRIGDLEDLRQEDQLAFNAAKKELYDRIDDVAERVGAVEDEQAAQKVLNDIYDQVFDALINKKIDGIAINASENPVTGYWNAAFLGSQLNLASSFYGTATQGSEDFEIEGGDVLGKNGNAGSIYLTLNPTEVNPGLVKSIKLVDSQGNEADGFELGELKNTDKVLTFGYSRAAETSANGFYEVPVIATNPKKPFDLNKGELAAVAKDILAELKNPKANNFQLREAAKALYGAGSSINNALKAYTVKIEYELLQYDATTKKLVSVPKHVVAPAYNMAAFNVKPLSFNFLKDNEKLNNLGEKFKGFSLENYALAQGSEKLRSFAQALDVEFTADDFYTYTFVASNTIFCEQDGSDVVMYNDAKVAYKGDTYEVINRGKEYKRFPNSTLDVNVIAQDDDNVGERIYVIKTKDDTIANLVADVNSTISGKLSPVQDKLNAAADRYDNVIGHVSDLISRIGAKVGSANKLLQPTILYIGNDGKYHPMSTIGGRLGARLVGVGETTIFATSWNAELLAPAYKKSVSIDGGAEVTLVDGTSAAKPFAGSTSKLVLNIKKAGNYTITYKAVDYSGVEVTKEFHVTAE